MRLLAITRRLRARLTRRRPPRADASAVHAGPPIVPPRTAPRTTGSQATGSLGAGSPASGPVTADPLTADPLTADPLTADPLTPAPPKSVPGAEPPRPDDRASDGGGSDGGGSADAANSADTGDAATSAAGRWRAAAARAGEARRRELARWRRCRALARERLWRPVVEPGSSGPVVVVHLAARRRVTAAHVDRVSRGGELPLRWAPEAAAEIRLRAGIEPEEWWAIALGPDPRRTPPDVAAELAREIACGTWPPGTRLPSIPELARLYGVAARTARKALARLETDGAVRVEPGRGTYVTGPPGP